MMTRRTEQTAYSAEIAGSPRTHQRSVLFDLTDGCVGITAREPDGAVADRVLLSPEQWRALVAFVANRGQ